MGFNWDEYPAEEGPGGDFLKEDDKIAMAVNKVPFYVTKIWDETVDYGKGKGPQSVWKFHMILMDGAEKIWGATKGVPARDKQALGLKAFLETEGAEPVKAIIVKVGRSFQIQGA